MKKIVWAFFFVVVAGFSALPARADIQELKVQVVDHLGNPVSQADITGRLVIPTLLDQTQSGHYTPSEGGDLDFFAVFIPTGSLASFEVAAKTADGCSNIESGSYRVFSDLNGFGIHNVTVKMECQREILFTLPASARNLLTQNKTNGYGLYYDGSFVGLPVGHGKTLSSKTLTDPFYSQPGDLRVGFWAYTNTSQVCTISQYFSPAEMARFAADGTTIFQVPITNEMVCGPVRK